MLLDLSGTLASLLCTYYLICLNRSAWLIGLVANLINGWLYWHAGIYADTLLELVYFTSTCYGWLAWQKTPQANSSPIRQLSSQQWPLLVLAVAGLYFMMFLGLKHFTTTTVADLDALTTALSLIAQLLMCRKVLQTWLLWLLTDTLYAYLYWLKGLPFHTLLMMIYMGMAVAGYWNWSKRQTTLLPLENVAKAR